MFNPSLFAGTEDLGLEETGAEATLDAVATEVSEIRAEIAEANQEIQEQGEVLDEVAEQVDSIEEAQEEVAELVEGMESLLSSGNFDSKAFAALYNQANTICVKRLGGGVEGTRLGAENLYDASTAATAARDGMEGFMDKVKSAGTAAINFIKKIFNTIVNFFVGLVNKGKGIIRKATGLRETLKKSDTKLKEKVKLGGWNGYIDYESKGLAVKSAELVNAQSNLATYAGLLDGEITLEGFKSAYDKLVSELKKDISAAGASKDEKGTLVAQIAGIRVLFSHGEGSVDDLSKAASLARGMSLRTAKADTFSKLTSGEVAPKLNAGALTAICTGVITKVEQLQKAKVDEKFSSAKRDKLIGYLNASAKSEDKDTGAKVNLVKAVCSSAASLTRSLNSLTMNFLEAQIDGVSAHV